MEADCPVGRYRCAPRGSWLSILNVSFSRQSCRRCPTFEQIARNHDFLHFGCAFIDTQGPNLAIELLDRGPLGDTCTARSITRCAASVANIFAMAASRVTRGAPRSLVQAAR